MRRSPSDVLITKWARYAHVVTELFKLLAGWCFELRSVLSKSQFQFNLILDMQHFAAMHEIKDLVDPRYHVWLKPVQPHFTRLMTGHSNKQNNMAKGQSQIFKANEMKAESCPKDDSLKENLKELLNIPEIPIEQLEEATNKWSEENVLGKGGFGVVYRGDWMLTKVAIKKLEYRESRSGSFKEHLVQSLNELRHLNHCRHDNILPIYGYALKGETCLVVYQLMTAGSLEERLSKRGGTNL